MIGAKKALAFGVERLSGEPSHDVSFAVACVDYLAYIMSRFVEQGRSNTSRLRHVVRKTDSEDIAVLADIEATLAETRKQLDSLIAARDRVKSESGNREAFIMACTGFLQFYDCVLARRKDPAQEIIKKHFDPETYWRETNDITLDSVATEEALFAEIVRLAPGDLQAELAT